MSSKKRIDDGGPAFPWHSDGMLEHEPPHPGMTLRDYFAAKALQGIMSSDEPCTNEQAAVWAYCIADAMLAARKR